MKGHTIIYDQSELDWIKAHSTMPRQQMFEDFCKKFGRDDLALSNLNSLCKRKGWMTGRDGRFYKNQTSLNKGKKMPYHAASAATQFKPGTAPPNRKPMWSERVGRDGYIEIKVPERNPHTGHATRYIHKHRWLWEQANGPLPKGQVLKSLDGNRTNTAAENWQAIPRAMLPRLNGKRGRDYDAAPDALKPAIMAVTKLEHIARQRTKPEGT